MWTSRRLAVSVCLATGLLLAGTVGLASVPPRPLRSGLTVVHALSFRVATDWLAVVALLAVGERYVSGRAVDRRTVGRLGAAVLLGGLAIEASPLLRLVVGPETVGTAGVVRGLVAAVQRALFPAGLFLGTVLGAGAARGAFGAGGDPAESGLPLAPSGRWVPDVPLAALLRAGRALAAVAACSFALEAGARLALGEPFAWLAVVDAGVSALDGLVVYAVLAGAFLALAVEGVRVRSVVVGTGLVWVAVFAAGVAVALLSALLGVALVSVTVTPMGAVEAAGFGQWPAPDSPATLLRVGTFLAGAVGLLAVQESVARRRRDPGAPAGDAERA